MLDDLEHPLGDNRAFMLQVLEECIRNAGEDVEGRDMVNGG